jgi:citrate lyase beta subunit
MHARRALLYMPGDDLRKIYKATTVGVDSICMDLEDGVAAIRKAEARAVISNALKSLEFGKSERLARINPVKSGLEGEDLLGVLPARPDGIVIPKVEDGKQVRWVSQQIAAVEQKYGWPIGEICLIVIIESARAIVNLPDIAGSDARLQALIFGAEDFATDIGASRTREGWEVFFARSAVVTHAAAYGLQAIDMVFVDFRDSQGLSKEALQGAQMGFAGKQIIHPDQVDPVQEAFSPGEEAIAHALRIVEASASHQKAGLGAFALDGKMVDAPVVKAAEQVLARARAAGKISWDL